MFNIIPAWKAKALSILKYKCIDPSVLEDINTGIIKVALLDTFEGLREYTKCIENLVPVRQHSLLCWILRLKGYKVKIIKGICVYTGTWYILKVTW